MSGNPPNGRQWPRFRYRARVVVKVGSARKMAELITQNVGQGGLFLAVDDPPPKGTRLTIDLALPDGSSVPLQGEVVHAVSSLDSELQKRPAGAGVRFLSLTEEQRLFVLELVEDATLTEHFSSGTNGHPSLPMLRGVLDQLKYDASAVLEGATREALRESYVKAMADWHPCHFVFEEPMVREVVAEISLRIHTEYKKRLQDFST